MKSIAISPAEFVQAVRSGDLAQRNRAFRSLYENRMVIATIADWVRFHKLTKHEPEDILQEGILKFDVLIREGVFRGESKVETFLLGICKNLIRDGVRTRSKVTLKSQITESDCPDADAVADRLVLVEQSQAENRRDELLHESIENLRDNCQDALKTYYFQEKSMADVAERRGLANADQAKKLVHRCRQYLRDLINGNPELLTILNQLT